MLNDDEKNQIEKTKRDPLCFEPLYRKYYQPILRFIYQRVEFYDDAKEIVAIVFAKALVNISKYSDQGYPFSSWLYRIAINEVNQFYRDTKKIRAISIDEKAAQNLVAETNTDKEELFSHLSSVLNVLSEDEYVLIELRYFEERPFSEVGEILGITENHAKVKTYRIIEKLKRVFET